MTEKSNEKEKKKRWGIAKRLSPKIAENGNYTTQALILIREPARLGLKPGPALWAAAILTYKWDERQPFPGLKKLAKKQNITGNTAREYNRILEGKGYLEVTRRYRIVGNEQTDAPASHEYDFSGLIEAIDQCIDEDAKDVYSGHTSNFEDRDTSNFEDELEEVLKYNQWGVE